MIDITIEEKLKEKCPHITIGCIEACVKVKSGSEELWAVIEAKCREIESEYKPEDVLKIENIDSSRRAYKALGKDPSRYRLSSESLVRRIVKGNGLYKVNNVVDINNLISLTSSYSVGTYDLDKVEYPIVFTIGKEGETYEGIGRGIINLENLPVFSDKQGHFGSTTSDSTRAMITSETTHIVMNIISFNGDKELSKYIDYGINLLENYAMGKILEVKIIS
ncbi:B3/B4 domain-containing protein [Clostridium sp. UBA4548]|uniref:B3/B4 domain-containing protein n=1 Tax=Clostridium sp. UBA4548 TaxID=1946361 RepID=UPI0025C20C09|nr:phenylalanine--tRNA ligase beta subunit-related protein [Clostridium sp. UBA4548]